VLLDEALVEESVLDKEAVLVMNEVPSSELISEDISFPPLV
jgi:hypothetical protein